MFNIPPSFYISPDLISTPIHIEHRVMTEVSMIASLETRIGITPKGAESINPKQGENRFILDLLSYFHANYDEILAS